MLANRQSMISSLRRDAWVEVDLNAIERNIAVIRSWLNPGTRLMAVVKSDAYGHGAVGVANVLTACGADWLGVASIDEGCQLRAAGVRQPILVLSPCPSWAVAAALDADLNITVTSISQIADIAESCRRQNRSASIHLKIDTGMHRLGVALEHIDDVIRALKKNPELRLTGLFSHFAKADEEEFTRKQTETFNKAIEKVKAAGLKPDLIHLASGEAARRFPFTHFDMVRVGLYMYGLEASVVSDVVIPAMSVKGRINHIQEIAEGESLGYSLTWTSSRKSRIASIPIGYADGIDRRLSNKLTGLLMGKQISQVGLISMDQMLFDITDVPQAQEGDVVTLLGLDHGESEASDDKNQLFLATWANLLDTITYELACRLRARMPRMYTRNLNLPEPAGPKQNAAARDRQNERAESEQEQGT
jgi:alanine racemase